MAFLEQDLEVKESGIPNSGMGLFTKVFIPKGTRIVEYKGRITTWKEVKNDTTNGYLYTINRNYVIDARPNMDALARYANDARGMSRVKGITNNCDYVNEGLKAYIEAKKDIPAGSELLVGYGKEYWDVMKVNLKEAAEAVEAEPKRGRGRPPGSKNKTAVKKKRGRPRKTESEAPKKKRGRPRKAETPLASGPKRGRGRPKKVVDPTSAPAKKKRGRPRKTETVSGAAAPKKRGRPRKHPLPVGPKRGRGRPRKEETAYVAPKKGRGRPKKAEAAAGVKRRGRPRKNPVGAAAPKRGRGRPKKAGG